jgi:hypothetical protein
MASSTRIRINFGGFLLELIDFGQYIVNSSGDITFHRCLILSVVEQIGQKAAEGLDMIIAAGNASKNMYLEFGPIQTEMHPDLTSLLANNSLLTPDLFRRIRWPTPWLPYIIVILKLDSQNKAVKEVVLYYNYDPNSGKDFTDMQIKIIHNGANHFQAAVMKNEESMTIQDLLNALKSLHENTRDPMDFWFSHYNCLKNGLLPILAKENVQICGVDPPSDFDSFKIVVATAAEVIDLSDESELISIFFSLLNSFFSIFILESLPQKRRIGKMKRLELRAEP